MTRDAGRRAINYVHNIETKAYPMQIFEPVNMALHSLWENKLRSFLTLIGIIIGMVVIIAMQSVMAGFRKDVFKEMSLLGNNTFQISKYPVNITGEDLSKYRNRKNLTYKDALAIKELTSHSAAVGIASIEGFNINNSVKYGERKTSRPVMIQGANPEFTETSGYLVDYGRFLTESDLLHKRKVVVLGLDIVETLFPYENPIGATVIMKGQPFLVIGAFEKRGAWFGSTRDNRVIIPYTTYQRIFGEYFSAEITVRAASTDEFNLVMDEAISILRTVRMVPIGEPNDFSVSTSASLMASFDAFTRMGKFAALGVASISLIVAGMGIMNMMWVTVTERTKEIGIRKSLGAKRRDILSQFLIESMMLCLFGAIIGASVGVLIAQGLGSVTSLPATVPFWAINIALVFCSMVGLFFGIYPAVKASNLDPIEALAYE